MRNAYTKKMLEICEKNENIMLLLVDSGDREYDELRRKFPQRIIECGISEENAIGVAAGIASEGMIPVVYGMAPFLVYRAFEFIRDDVCLQNMNVKIVGTGAGVIYNNLGPTHHATEDIGILRTVPNITIISPASPKELEPCLEYAVDYKGPVYVRMGKAWEEEIYNDEVTLPIDEPALLAKGDEICIVSTGSIIATALKVKEILDAQGLSASVLNIRKIKPIQEKILVNKLKNYQEIITIEEHNTINGLGSMISELVVKYRLDTHVYKIGFEDKFCTDYGWYQDIKKLNGLEESIIAKEIMGLYR